MCSASSSSFYFSLRCSQCWFATLHEVLLADWHDVWHSPQPPLTALSFILRVSNVTMCFILLFLLIFEYLFLTRMVCV